MSGVDEDALFLERFVPGEMHGLIEAEHLSRYWWASAYVDARRVLDAGCGVGYGSRLLAAAGARSVSGVDISDVAIAEASERRGERVTFSVGDLAALPFQDGSFDVAVCFETIEHVADQSRALGELRRVLARDGLLLISSPNRSVYQQGNACHTSDELGAALGKHFAQVRLERQATWLASMILVPGRETFTLGLASNAELPPTRALTLLAGAQELEAWRQRRRSAEQHAERARAAGVKAATASHSLEDAYHSALATIEQQAERAREAGADAAASYRSLEEAYHNALATIEQQAERAREAGVDAAASYRSLEDTYRALRRDYDNALAAIEQHEATAAALAEQQRALRVELDAVAAREHQLSARADELARELDAANAELAAIRDTRVWRASAPLRLLTRRGRAD